MSLIPWKNKNRETDVRSFPESRMVNLRSEIDRLFDRFVGEGWPASEWFAGTKWTPSLDLSETDKEITIKAEVPGIDVKDIDISVSGNTLVIQGEKKEETEEKNKDYYHSERKFGSFRRSIELPESADTDNVSAEHGNGVLTLRIKKLASATSKRIPLTAAKH